MSMTDWTSWRRLLRLPGGDVKRSVDDEIAFHIEMRTRDLVAEGKSEGFARSEAEREFGEMRSVRDACVTIEQRRQRKQRWGEGLSGTAQDVRFAVRTLRKNAGFTAAAIVCLALGVGVTTTVFSAVNATLVRPLPFERPNELVAVYSKIIETNEGGVNISYPDYLSWRDENRSFAQFGMYTWQTLTFLGDLEAERVEGAAITAGVFPMLGVKPLLGRTFLPGEEKRGNDRVVLLGYGIWQRRFAGARDIVGRSVTIDSRPYTVIGVMPRGFAFPERGQAWVPLQVDLERESHGNRYFAGALGRLKPGVTVAQAQSDLSTIMKRLATQLPNDNKGWDADVLSLRDDLVGDLRRPLLVFSVAVLFVLLITCVNVANLMLARSTARQREIAVRTALGAGRGRLVRQLLTESLVLAVAGGAIGAVLSVFGVAYFRGSFPQDVPYYLSLHVDRPTLAFAIGISVLTGVIFGLMPALRTSRGSIDGVLRDAARGATTGMGASRLRGALVVTELALSVVLMVGAGLLIKSYRSLAGTTLGFEPQGVLTFRLTLPSAKYTPWWPRRIEFYDRVLERLGAVPGVAAAAAAQGVPFSGWNVQGGFQVEGRPPARPGEDLESLYQNVSPNFLATLGVPIIRGRPLLPSDRDTANPVGVINESFVKRAFPGEDPIGKRIRFGGPNSQEPWITIVGVARDYRHYRLPEPMGPAIHMPYAAYTPSTETIVLRVKSGKPESLVPTVRRIVREMESEVPMYRVMSMDQIVAGSLWRQRLQGQVLGLFATLAILLATVGIYGVISYAVLQRTREFGVRVALGAQRRDVIGLVLAEGGKLAVVGVVLGIGGALLLTGLISKLLYEVKPTDPATFVGVALGLATLALVASYVPARRATRIDPIVAMKPD
jgi:putative ABC transport system permease protein